MHGGDMKIVGKILWWDKRDQNGIIVDAQGNEYYFDISVVEGRKASGLRPGCVVQFQVNPAITQAAKAVRLPPSKTKTRLEKEFNRNLQLAFQF
jgi:cold shock CspA family protein